MMKSSLPGSRFRLGHQLLVHLSSLVVVGVLSLVFLGGCADSQTNVENIPEIPPGNKSLDPKGKASVVPQAPGNKK